MTKKQNTIPLSAEQLRAALVARVQPQPVEVPGVGTMYVKAPSWLDSGQAPTDEAAAATGLPADKLAQAWALAVVLCDANGTPLFDAASADDLRAVAALDRVATAPLVTAASKVYSGEQKND